MESNEMKRLLGRLTNEQVAEFAQYAAAEADQRRPGVSMDMIRPGMSKDDETAVRAAIRRVLEGNR